MFRHKGKGRRFKHNLRIASLLSFIAGIVNVVGFLSIKRLTTNITGHFAFFVDEVLMMDLQQGLVYFLYICFFFLGSFVSSFLVESVSHKKEGNQYVIPTIIESLLLLIVAIFGSSLISERPDLIAFLLLFAMGLQNSLVTSISNATVRTTHLTGLVTDLGIELSQLFFYKQEEQKKKLYSSIKLRLTIIAFFFLGGILGGIFYSMISLYVLVLAATILLSGIAYDKVKFMLILNRRKQRSGKRTLTIE